MRKKREGFHQCRYCAFCFEADDFRCSAMPDGKELHMDENDIKKINSCKDFALSDLGCVITGKQYKPREKRKKKLRECEGQIRFEL